MTTLHLSPRGSDRNSGRSSAEALASLPAAREAVRKLLAAGEREVTVTLAPGEYFLSEPLHLSSEDGVDKGRVTWCGSGVGEAVVNGGHALTDWEEVGGGVYRAPVPKGASFGSIFENGVAAPLCRHPAEGYLTTRRVVKEDMKRSFEFDAADLPAIAPGQALSVFMFPGGPHGDWNWHSMTLPVEVDTSRGRATLAAEAGYDIGAGSRYFWRGAREFLTSPGQFWLDPAGGQVYYRPRFLPIREQTIVVPVADRVIELRGASQARPVRNVRLENLVIRSSDVPLVEGPRPRMSGAVHLENAEDIEVRFCRIHNTGLHGVYLTGWAQRCVVYGCSIHDVGHTGVQLDGERGRAVMTCRGNRIVNNHIHDTGRNVGHGAGIMLSFAGENTISHNRVHHAPRYAISLKGPCPESMVYTEVDGVRITPENVYDYHFTRDNVISYNDMFRVNLDTQDTGVYESWGTGLGNQLLHNRVHDSDIEFSFGFGIYLDDASSGYTVKGNLVHGLQRGGKGTLLSPVYTKGLNNTFENNFLVDNPTAAAAIRSHAYGTEPCRWLRFSRNVMCRSGKAGIGFVNWDWERMTASDHNVYAPGTDYYHWSHPNTGKDLPRWDAHMRTIYDLHSIVAEPGFMDSAAQDYRLRYDSPARALEIVDVELAEIGLLADYPFGRGAAKPASIYLRAVGSISFVRLRPGQETALEVLLRDEDGVPMKPEATGLTFSCDDPKVAGVDPGGRVSARAPGVVVIRARYAARGASVATFIHAVVAQA